MELFKYINKSGSISIVHTKHHEDRFDKEWSLRVDGNPYDYYKREQDAKGAGKRLKKSLIENGCIIINPDAVRVSREKWNSTDSLYKGIWEDVWADKPEWAGRKTMMCGCLGVEPDKCRGLRGLLIEGIDFYVVE